MVDLEFWKRNSRKRAASRLAVMTGYGFAEILTTLEEMGVYDSWTEEDFIEGRPMDFDELEYFVSERIEEGY